MVITLILRLSKGVTYFTMSRGGQIKITTARGGARVRYQSCTVQMTNEVSGWIIKLEKVGTSEEIDESDWLILLDKFVAWAEVCETLNDFLGSIKGLENGEKDIAIDDAVKTVTITSLL